MAYRFKRIKSEDFAELKDFFLRNKDTDFFDPFPLDEKRADYIANVDKDNLYYGIFNDEKIIGFGMLRWHKEYKSPTLGLVVDKEYRGMGLGTKIYVFLFKKCKEKKCREVFAIIHKNNIPSMHIVKRLGMSEINKNKLSIGNRYDFSKFMPKLGERIIFVKNL